MFYKAFSLSKKVFLNVIEWPYWLSGAKVEQALPMIAFFLPVTLPLATMVSVLMFPPFLLWSGLSKLGSFFNPKNKKAPQETSSAKTPAQDSKTNPFGRLLNTSVRTCLPENPCYLFDGDLSPILANLTSAVHQRAFPTLKRRDGWRILPCLRVEVEGFTKCRIKHLVKTNEEVLIKLTNSRHYQVLFKEDSFEFFSLPSDKHETPFYIAKAANKDILGRVLQGVAQTAYWNLLESDKNSEKDSASAAAIVQKATSHTNPPSSSEMMKILKDEKAKERPAASVVEGKIIESEEFMSSLST